MDNKSLVNEFYESVFQYFSDVLIGIETKLFKACEEDQKLKEKLISPDGMVMASNTLETYLNHVYRGLVDKNDEFVLDQFKRFEQFTPMKSAYLLNLISVTAMNAYQKMNRSKLDISSNLDTYLASVRANVEIMKKYYLFLFDKDYAKHKDVKPTVTSEN